MTHFEALYGYSPPVPTPYIAGIAELPEVNTLLVDRTAMIRLLRFHLHRAQHRMLQIANKKRTERKFQIGEWAYVKLISYKQQPLARRGNQKLSPLYYDTYLVIDKVGEVAYRLELPPHSSIHSTFHVSKLKKYVKGNQAISATLPYSITEEQVPETILDRKMVKRCNRFVTKVLVKWKNKDSGSATWEYLYDLHQRFPNHTLGDKGAVGGEDLLRVMEAEPKQAKAVREEAGKEMGWGGKGPTSARKGGSYERGGLVKQKPGGKEEGETTEIQKPGNNQTCT